MLNRLKDDDAAFRGRVERAYDKLIARYRTNSILGPLNEQVMRVESAVGKCKTVVNEGREWLAALRKVNDSEVREDDALKDQMELDANDVKERVPEPDKSALSYTIRILVTECENTITLLDNTYTATTSRIQIDYQRRIGVAFAKQSLQSHITALRVRVDDIAIPMTAYGDMMQDVVGEELYGMSVDLKDLDDDKEGTERMRDGELRDAEGVWREKRLGLERMVVGLRGMSECLRAIE